MKKVIIPLVILFLTGCTEPKLSTLDPASIEASFLEIIDSKDVNERNDLTMAILTIVADAEKPTKIYPNQLPTKIFVRQFLNNREELWPMFLDISADKLEGKNYKELLAEATRIRLVADKNLLELLLTRKIEYETDAKKSLSFIEDSKGALADLKELIETSRSKLDQVSVVISKSNFTKFSLQRAKALVTVKITNDTTKIIRDATVTLNFQAKETTFTSRNTFQRTGAIGKSGLAPGESASLENWRQTMSFTSIHRHPPALTQADIVISVYTEKVIFSDGVMLSRRSIKQLEGRVAIFEKTVARTKQTSENKYARLKVLDNDISALSEKIASS